MNRGGRHEAGGVAPARWIAQTPMSDPSSFADKLGDLPDGVGALGAIVQGALVHLECLAVYGLSADPAKASRETLPIAARLRDVFALDPSPLAIGRDPASRSRGTCRDFALLLSSLLRTKGLPARLRCGFASYLGEGWEDHWLCEYWDAGASRWRRVDAMLDPVLAERWSIDFDPLEVPSSVFKTAGEAWLDCRAGRSDAADFGHRPTKGLWFLHVNVIRDHYALNERETSPWDAWRGVAAAEREVPESRLSLLDALAADPSQALVANAPPCAAGDRM